MEHHSNREINAGHAKQRFCKAALITDILFQPRAEHDSKQLDPAGSTKIDTPKANDLHALCQRRHKPEAQSC